MKCLDGIRYVKMLVSMLEIFTKAMKLAKIINNSSVLTEISTNTGHVTFKRDIGFGKDIEEIYLNSSRVSY